MQELLSTSLARTSLSSVLRGNLSIARTAEHGLDSTDSRQVRGGQLVASNHDAAVKIEPSTVSSSLNDRLELAILRLAVHGAFVVLTEGTHARFIAGGHKINRNDAFSELDFSTGADLWLHCNDADLPIWLWLFERSIANSTCETAQGQTFMIPSLQHKSETNALSSVVGSPHLRFYAGTPLVSKGGQFIGVLFVVDTISRCSLSAPEATFLKTVGTKCVEILDRAREQVFHNRWIVLQEQLDVFAQSPPMQAAATGGSRLHEETPTSMSAAHNSGPERAQSTIISGEQGDMALEGFAHQVPHGKSGAQCQDAPEMHTSTGKLDKDGHSKEHSSRTKDTLYRKVFRKAAQCLQYALDAEGVLFSGGLAGLHGDTQPSTETELEPLHDLSQSPPQDVNAVSVETKSNTRTFTGTGYHQGVHIDGPAEIFGFSGCSEHLNLPSPSTSSTGLCGLDDSFLERLMDRHPKGAMWLLTNTSIFQVKDGSLFEVDPQEEMARLQFTFPEAKQLMYMPLNDPTSAKRLCACFAWRNQTRPVFADAADLGSLKVFSRVVESAIGRYDTAAVAKQKETFVSSVSHELRTPLHGILGAVQLLDESGLDPLQKSLAGIITSCGSTLHETLTSVLSYAKINQFERYQNESRKNESRRHHTSNSPWALSERPGFVSGPGRDFVGLYTRTNIALLCEEVVGVAESGRSFQSSADEEVIVVCDISYAENWSHLTESGAIRRIAINLVGNALRYTKKGSVTVSLTASEPARHPVTPGDHVTTSRTVTLTVKDTGKGMSKEFLQNQLFIPFTQEDPTASNGVGLGMSIVKSLVTLLSGQIRIRSDVHLGTEIDIHLPMRMCDTKDEHESSPTSTFEHNTKTLRTLRLSVIMFGFPEFVRASLRTYLCEWYNCILLENIGDVKPDIVLVDEGDEEALEEVKKTADAYGLQAVLLSAVLVISMMGKRMDTIRGYKKWERIPRPIGPGNVGKGLMGCLPKLDELKKQGHGATSDVQESSSKFDQRTGELSSDSTKDISKGLPMWAMRRLQLSEHTGVEALKRERSASLTTANHEPKTGTPPSDKCSDSLPSSKNFRTHGAQNFDLRILLVDDNELNLKLLGVFLKRNGYHNTQKAKNGLEAVEAVRECQGGFDVVFMDLSMPVMDGFEATRTIRTSESEQNAPVATKPIFIVALTGLASANDEKKAFDAGVDMYLTKPVQFSKLTTLLREYTDKASSSESN